MPRKSDITAVAKILQDPDFESPEEAAVAVIEALDAARRDRLGYAVAVQGLPVAYVYHGFENREEAIRWLKRSGIDVVGLSVGVIPVFNKDHPLERHRLMTEDLRKKQDPGHPVAGRRKRAG